MPTLLEAFTTLGLSPDTPEDDARAAYKKLALRHHPDRNHGDAGATERFQEIGAAWEVCLRHYEGVGDAGGFEGRSYADDEEIPLNAEEAQYFFRFMFEEMLFNRFSSARARRYRDQRSSGASGGMHAFSGGLAESQKRQDDNAARIRKENEAYQERVRELDREIAAQQAAKAQRAREAASAQDRLVSLQHRAFALARAGDGAGLRATVAHWSSLDVTGPERLARARNKPYETLLHVAAGNCDVATVEFLLARGADPAAISPANLTPFHVAVLHGNAPVAAFFLARPRHAEEGAHPSKAAPDGRTPLQLALVHGNIEVLRIVLRHATVHDVARAWAMDGLTSATREALLTKKGFVPPDTRCVPTSQKEHKAEQARLAKEEKKRRVEEQERRAEANRKRREERAQRAREEEAAVREKARLQEEARQKAQEEERRRIAEEAQRQAEQQARRKAKEESRQRQAEEATQRRAAQMQAEEQAIRRAEARRARARDQADQARRAAEERAAAEARRVAKQVQEAQQRLRDEEDARLRRVAVELLERESQLRREKEEAEMRRIQGEKKAREAEQAAIRYAEEAKVRAREEEARREREAATMRRRAEQSARDKARNQRMRAERELERARQRQAPDAGADTHPQPATSLQTPTSSPPNPGRARRPAVPLSPPVTPEDIQTRAAEDEVFAYESPARTRSGLRNSVYRMHNNRGPRRGGGGVLSSKPPQPRQSEGERGRGGRGRGRGRGNVFRGRGRGRERGSRLGLEEQLERKELEIRQIRAQLAEGSAGVR